jgi:hypothetical protein
MKNHKILALLSLGILLGGCGQKGSTTTESTPSEAAVSPAMNTLSEDEVLEGWVLLFDGETTAGWKNYNEDTLTGWTVEDGCLVAPGTGTDLDGDIVTVKSYGDFILKWDWKLVPRGNSGVMYHVVEAPDYRAVYYTGPEYQMIDDYDFWEDGKKLELEAWQRTAADYAMYIPPEDKELHTGDWNSSMIYFSPEKAEYWLNGKKMVEFVPWSEDWYERRNSGKWDPYPDYGLARSGKICLQDHGYVVRFRNIKLREL